MTWKNPLDRGSTPEKYTIDRSKVAESSKSSALRVAPHHHPSNPYSQSRDREQARDRKDLDDRSWSRREAGHSRDESYDIAPRTGAYDDPQASRPHKRARYSPSSDKRDSRYDSYPSRSRHARDYDDDPRDSRYDDRRYRPRDDDYRGSRYDERDSRLDRSSRYDDHYRAHRHSPVHHSRVGDRRDDPKRRSASPEDGEIDEGPARPPTPPGPPPRDSPPSHHRRLTMKNRPAGQDNLMPPRPPSIPPPPPGTAPPSPPAQAPPSPPTQPPPPPTQPPEPRTPAEEKARRPEPPSLPSSERQAKKLPDAPVGPGCPIHFRRPSDADEKVKFGRTFTGVRRLDAYELGRKLGEGTFGVVTKGVEKATKRPIALKKLLVHNPRDGVSLTTVREIKLLKSLDHKNVVKILDMVVEPKTGDKAGRQEVFMVFPYMHHDLCGLLSNNKFSMTASLAKSFMKQMLEGMAYIHSNHIIHRDIKTANILVDEMGQVMIADFGLARPVTHILPRHLEDEKTNMVVTRWYRAPELLLGETRYGPSIDMWSMGCILGELFKKSPILPGGPNDVDQLFEIFARCGPLNEGSFPGWKKLPGHPGHEGTLWDLKVHPMSSIRSMAAEWKMDKGAIDLMMRLLKYDPAARLTADDALDHAWFYITPLPQGPKNLGVESSHEFTAKRGEDKMPQAPARATNAFPPRHQPTWPGRPPHPPPQAWAPGAHQPNMGGMGPGGMAPGGMAPGGMGPGGMGGSRHNPGGPRINPPMNQYQNGPGGYGMPNAYRGQGYQGPALSTQPPPPPFALRPGTSAPPPPFKLSSQPRLGPGQNGGYPPTQHRPQRPPSHNQPGGGLPY